jgi:hypothetical protein
MKNKTKLALAVLALTAFSTSSFAQASATATATATIVTPISITKTVDMNFGNVAVQTGTGGVTLPAVPGTVTAASFTVNGQGT